MSSDLLTASCDESADTMIKQSTMHVRRKMFSSCLILFIGTRAEAIGKVAHELLKTTFPIPLEQITDALLRDGRWEGELLHRKRDGTQLIVASRWSLQRDE